MTGTAGLLVMAAGVWLWWGAPARGRIGLTARVSRVRSVDGAAALAALGVAVMVGGLFGLVAGLVVGVGARYGLDRIRPGDKTLRQALSRQAPDAVDCLASCLAAGSALWPSIAVVSQAFGQPLQQFWDRATDRHALGASAQETFDEWLQQPELEAVARVLIRSSESGAALAASLMACAQHLREQRAQELQVRAQAVGVRAVAPLGLCFLPAFVLLAVVPIVGSLAQDLL